MPPYSTRIWLRVVLALAGCATAIAADLDKIPRYDHILIIIAENHTYQEIVGNSNAPNLNRLATTYGLATNYYGVAHPSEANYIAMIGGDTFGIHDDDAWYCRAGIYDRDCASSANEGYVDHTVTARSLVDQLAKRNLSWKGYFENIPAPGSKAVYWPDENSPVAGLPNKLYAEKHNAFIHFSTVQNDSALASKLVGFDQLFQDLAARQVPNYVHIVPNQCNDMHGLSGLNVPIDCQLDNDAALIARSDKAIGELVKKIQASPIWSEPGNAAIIITWDESDGPSRNIGPQGCCGFEPTNPANRGGGHVATLVVTNHGPRGVTDDTPYNHYSLLRTTEEALGIEEYLGHAKDVASGVKVMTKLFKSD